MTEFLIKGDTTKTAEFFRAICADISKFYFPTYVQNVVGKLF